jgi:hypothetical protein
VRCNAHHFSTAAAKLVTPATFVTTEVTTTLTRAETRTRLIIVRDSTDSCYTGCAVRIGISLVNDTTLLTPVENRMLMRRIVVPMAVSLVLLEANGCMMMGGGMMGGGMMHAGSGGARGTSARAEHVANETTVGNIRVAVDYPAASVGKDITYIVHVSDAASMHPIDDAHIRTLIRSAPTAHASGQPAGHAEELGITTQSPGVRRLDTPGVYAFNHLLARPGVHEIAVVVDAVGDRALDPPVTVSAVREVSMDHDQRTTRSTITPTVLAVGAAMTAMMVLMMRSAF